jgi:hypothetical protein
MLTDNDLQLMMLFIQSNEGAKRKRAGVIPARASLLSLLFNPFFATFRADARS